MALTKARQALALKNLIMLPIATVAWLVPLSLAALADDPSASPSPSPSPSLASGAATNVPTTQEQDDAALVDPLTPNRWYSFEDEAMQSVSGPSNQLDLQAQIPLAAAPPIANFIASGHALSLIKLKVPIVLGAPSNTGIEAATGTGDVTTTWVAGFGTAWSRWAGGATFKFPTGSGSLGSGKWSAGPALGYTHETGLWTFGAYSQSFFSYAGSGSRSPVAQSQLQPSISVALPNGWSLGTSEMKFTYDYDEGSFVSVPVGIRVAKQFKSGSRRLNAYFEAEKNLKTSAGTTWTLRLGAKLVLLRT
ncbi:MAG TPA: hypothetical protein VGF86_12110 [Candidatus Tumulicola sp.]|jgi:hypothetical protein